MKCFITGDVHGNHDLDKLTSSEFTIGDTLTKDDIVFVAGDLGAVWGGDETDKYWQDWYDSKPWTTCSVDGNHENHDLLEKLPEVSFYGGIAKKVNDSLYYLNRGEVYTFNGKKVFTFGGGISIDRHQRAKGDSWWEQEIPSLQEFEYALDNLSRHNFNVDYVITHTAPLEAIRLMIRQIADPDKSYVFSLKAKDKTVEYLSNIENVLEYKKWFFGHFHQDNNINDKFMALYYKIIELDMI